MRMCSNVLSALPTSPPEIGTIMFGIVAAFWKKIFFLEMLVVLLVGLVWGGLVFFF